MLLKVPFYNKRVPWRAGIAVQMFFATFVSYMLRVNMSLNIIAMVEATTKGGKRVESECINQSTSDVNTTAAPLPNNGPRYNWDKNIQGQVLAAYFYGYPVSCLPGGVISERYGPVKVVFYSTLLSGIFTLLTPPAAMVHWGLVIFIRIMLGLFAGFLYPALHCLISRWAPPDEKGKFMAALFGNAIGTVTTLSTLGLVIESMGWLWAFMIPGAISILWCFCWCMTVADYPDTHKYISEEEKEYINTTLAGNITKTKKIPPYGKIFTSVPFWALNACHFGNLWGLYLLLQVGPMYMYEGLGFNIKESGGLSALPYLCRTVFGLIFGQIGDTLRKRNVNITLIRKVFIIFSHLIPGTLLYLIIAIGCNTTAAVALVTFSLGSNGASSITNLQNSQDLAPNFAGTIYGIINCMGSFAGIFTPSLTSLITSKMSGMSGWHMVFIIGATVYVVCGLVFIVFGSGQKQAFNDAELRLPRRGEATEGEPAAAAK